MPSVKRENCSLNTLSQTIVRWAECGLAIKYVDYLRNIFKLEDTWYLFFIHHEIILIFV